MTVRKKAVSTNASLIIADSKAKSVSKKILVAVSVRPYSTVAISASPIPAKCLSSHVYYQK